MQKAVGLEVWIGESLPSSTRLMGHGKFIYFQIVYRESVTSICEEFILSFMKAVLRQPFRFQEKYCSSRGPFSNCQNGLRLLLSMQTHYNTHQVKKTRAEDQQCIRLHLLNLPSKRPACHCISCKAINLVL